ncbi:MAG: nucleotidyltransferase domain-containing protein [Deltaproteobacteria bacterium]|nr:nucleotidyltransferase domain-containing protein [Deltaproteobacteria bacterium]
MEIIKRRKRELRKRVELARGFLQSIYGYLSPMTAIIIGSTARGDFNQWSDIDLVIISDRFPENPIDRFRMVELRILPGIEPIPLRTADLMRLVEKKAPVLEDMVEGIFLVDDLGIRRVLLDRTKKRILDQNSRQ